MKRSGVCTAYNSLTLILQDTVLDFDNLKTENKEWYAIKEKGSFCWQIP